MDVFAKLVEGYPDKKLRDAVLNGLRNGFDIGFNGIAFPTAPRNLRFARDNEEQVSAAVQLEVTRGHTAGPFT